MKRLAFWASLILVWFLGIVYIAEILEILRGSVFGWLT